MDRIAIFIDGSNLYNSLKRFHISAKIQDIVEILSFYGKIENIFYYTARLDPEFDKLRYLKHENFLRKISQIDKLKVVICNLRKTNLHGKEEYTIKRDDVRLANDMLVGAYENFYDTAIIVSGDEDFVPILETLRRLHKKVINAYFPKNSSYLLRKAANYSINLKKKLKSPRAETAPDSY